MTTVKRDYYPSGILRSETPMAFGRVHGLTKGWHSNGVLASEVPFENGMQHGVAKFWAADGRFLGDYLMDHGTGVVKLWYDNGVLRSEVPFLSGLLTGCQKSWDELGEPGATVYWIRGKKVSRKKYIQASTADTALPQCTN